MERAGGRPKDLDIWKHVTVMEGKRVKCNHCGLVFAASANRIKSHINQIKGNGIRLCTRVPQPNNIGSNQRVDGDLKENLTDSQGLSILDRPRDYNKLNEKMLNCYMSPKTMWEGIIAHRQVQTNVETKHHEKIQVGPFSVSNMVNVQDLQLIQYVFNLSPDECETYTVFSSSHSFLNQSEFTTLKPQTLLDSLVIDIFAEILTNIERKKKTTALNWYLPVTFSNAAINGDVSSFLDFVERQNMRENYMSDLVHCEKNKEVEIWDSLSSQFINEKERDEITQKLLFVLDYLFIDDIWEISWTFLTFDLRMATNTPLQPNGYDCGIFVINFMQQSANYVKINPSFQFDSDEERLDLTLKLLKSDLNKERKKLYHEAAKRHYAQGGNENDSDLQEVKRKLIDPCKTLSEDDRREADMGLDNSVRRVRSNIDFQKGCAKVYILPTTDLVGKKLQIYTGQISKWLMRDEGVEMAISMVKETNKIMAKANMNLIEIPDEGQWKEDLRKVFLTGNVIQKIPDGVSPRCYLLSTLLLDRNKDLKFISDDFFINMPVLRVLDLSKTGIKYLPKSVSNLECLLALLLSKCNSLSYVPSLAKLQRLISLDLFATAITEAPSGLELLVNLRRLNLQKTRHLKMSTSSVISKMTKLQSLYLNWNPKSMDVSAQDLQGMKELEAISANFCDIKEFNAYLTSFLDRDHVLQNYYFGLTKTKASYDYLNGSLASYYATKRVDFEGLELGNTAVVLPEDIKELNIKKCSLRGGSLCHVLSFLKNNNPCKIECFDIRRCDNMEYFCCFFPNCPFCSSVQVVGYLGLWGLKDLQDIVAPLAPSSHPTTLFSHLTFLIINGCNSMKTLLTLELLVQFQNLETIDVSYCKSMKEIISERSRDEGFSEMTFLISGNYSDHQTISVPRVKSVKLRDLPELNFVYRGIILCPSIQQLIIENCEKLMLPEIQPPLQITKTRSGYSLEKID